MPQQATHQPKTTETLIELGKVCGQVAHDIRGRLFSITTFLRYLPDKKLPKRMIELKGLISISCSQLHQMSEELLDYNKATKIEKKLFNLSLMIQQICNEFKFKTTNQNAIIRYDGPSSLIYNGDEVKLARTFQNLIQNALYAMKNTNKKRLTISVKINNHKIYIAIKDNGAGIDNEDLNEMFKPNFTTKGDNGNGLGLAYCSMVINGLGGQITAKNREKGGAEFNIELPNDDLIQKHAPN